MAKSTRLIGKSILPSDTPQQRRLKRKFYARGRPSLMRMRGDDGGIKVHAIRIINFKAFEDTGWIPIKPVTYLMGSNSAGKTSILNAIKFITSVINKEIPPFEKEQYFLEEFPLSDNKTDMNLGTFSETVFDGKENYTIELRVLHPQYRTQLTYSFTLIIIHHLL